jgi:hypothetical protein
MPNKNTFSILPIKELLQSEMGVGRWVDPYARNSCIEAITNDLNPETSAQYHMDAIDFLKMFDTESVDGVLYDPPYSLRQVKECYNGIGLKLTHEDTTGHISAAKNEISRILRPGGKAISFGWNSNGIGEKRGFDKTRILIVAHGGLHNDTICVVEIRRSKEKELW